MMKKVFLPIMMATTIFGFEITMSKSFEKKIKPDTLTISVSISTTRQNSKDVLDKLSSYSDFIKTFKDLKIKGGVFNTHPKYRYSNSSSKMIGYVGSINYQVTCKNKQKLKNFLSMLTAKNMDKDVELSIGSGSWKVDQKSIKVFKDELRFEALSWADEYAKKLSQKTGKSCEIKSVNFNRTNYNRAKVFYEAKEISVADKSIPMPTKSIQKIKIESNFSFECK